MVQLELSYLHEIERLTIGGADIIGDLERKIGLHRSDLPLDALVETPLCSPGRAALSTATSWQTHSSPAPHWSRAIHERTTVAKW